MKRNLIIISIVVLAAGAFFLKSRNTVRVSTLESALTPETLAQQADLILLGRFTSSTTGRDIETASGKLPSTEWTVEPIEVWKGTPPKPMIVTVLGGVTAEEQVIAENETELKKNLEALIFLEYIPEERAWVLSSASQGVFTKQGNQYVNAIGGRYDASTFRAHVEQLINAQ